MTTATTSKGNATAATNAAAATVPMPVHRIRRTNTTTTQPNQRGSPANNYTPTTSNTITPAGEDGGGPVSGASATSQRIQCFKTKRCRFWIEGRCSRGDSCTYAHLDVELRPPPDLTKTKLCSRWKQNLCTKAPEECAYAHGVEDLRSLGGSESANSCSPHHAGGGSSTEQTTGITAESKAPTGKNRAYRPGGCGGGGNNPAADRDPADHKHTKLQQHHHQQQRRSTPPGQSTGASHITSRSQEESEQLSEAVLAKPTKSSSQPATKLPSHPLLQREAKNSSTPTQHTSTAVSGDSITFHGNQDSSSKSSSSSSNNGNSTGRQFADDLVTTSPSKRLSLWLKPMCCTGFGTEEDLQPATTATTSGESTTSCRHTMGVIDAESWIAAAASVTPTGPGMAALYGSFYSSVGVEEGVSPPATSGPRLMFANAGGSPARTALIAAADPLASPTSGFFQPLNRSETAASLESLESVHSTMSSIMSRVNLVEITATTATDAYCD